MRFGLVAATLALACGLAAPGARAAPDGQRHAVVHECMKEWKEAHVPAYRAEVRSEMHAWELSNPHSSKEARKAEHHSLVVAEHERVKPEIMAAREACRARR